MAKAMTRAFEAFNVSPFPGLEWADTLSVEEARAFQTERDKCPDLLGLTGCCSPGVCARAETLCTVTLSECFHCLNPRGPAC